MLKWSKRHDLNRKNANRRGVRSSAARNARHTSRALAEDLPKAWKSVQQTVERRSGLAYEEACRALADLSEVYSLHASGKIFEQELRKFMARHVRRKALIQRLVKAGIWHEK